MAPNHSIPADFADWLLEDQLRFLTGQLDAQTLPELLTLCADLPDSAPLLHVVQQALGRSLPLGNLARTMLSMRPSTLQSLCDLEGLSEPAREAWRRAELPHLLHFCLLDRYLRRRAPQLWEQCMAETVQAAREALQSSLSPGPELLMKLPGGEQTRLRESSPRAWNGWEETWRAVSREAITLLADQPRGVSQANAERLLAQQVYTDPGHFLLELLQNADDAGASEFAVEFLPDQLVVTHNGEPFDFRDLVGILSIGQTTKKISQIGFFGVGFKSIYEVTDRPRLHSGYFHFEIADVSIPRPLGEREYSEETRLVLPLKPGLDPTPFWEKAVSIEPALLLNVPHLRQLRWVNGQQKIILRVEEPKENNAVLHRGDTQEEFLVWRGHYKHEGPRVPGKPRRAHLHLAFPRGELAPFSPTLYSFLPVSEDSGLAFIIGSHFDVPVDRERLDPSSAWNRGIVSEVANLIASRLKASPQQAWELLAQLPLPEDPVAPLFGSLSEKLAHNLRSLALVPGEQARRAEEIHLLDDDLEQIFEGVPGAPHHEPNQRRREWLQKLGATPYTLATLLAQLEGGQRPGRLEGDQPEPWVELHHLLVREPDTPEWRAQIRALPIVLDQNLQPVAPQSLAFFEPGWLELFRKQPRTVHPELNHPTTAALLAQLGVTVFGWEQLVRHVQDHGTSNLDSEKLLTHLLQAPRAIVAACLENPICHDLEGNPGRLVPLSVHHLGLIAASKEIPPDLFPELRFVKLEPALDKLLEQLYWPRFDLGTALVWLAREQILLDSQRATHLLQLILKSEYSWTAEALDALVSLSIFETEDGTHLPLDLIWLYDDSEMSVLLPGFPELKRDSASARVVEKLGLSHHLNKADLETLIAHLDELKAEQALPYLLARVDKLNRYQLSLILAQPMFEGRAIVTEQTPAGATCTWVAEPDLAPFFSALGLQVLSSELSRQLLPLLKAAGYPLLGLSRLLEHLFTRGPSLESLPDLQRVLLERASELQLMFSEEHRQQLPIWRSRNDDVLPSNRIPPREELAEQLGLSDRRPHSENHPNLESVFPFSQTEDYLELALARESQPGAALSQQPFWCNTLEAVDFVASHLQHQSLAVDALERLRRDPLLLAPASAHPFLRRTRLFQELLHPDASQEQKEQATRVAPSTLLGTYLELSPTFEERQSFYTYLEHELPSVAADSAARVLLQTEPFWLSHQGKLKPLSRFILDPDFPDLGQDWHPNIEIPASLLVRLESVLGVGRPEPLQLLEEHLIPAYHQTRTLSQREQLLGCIARLTEEMDQATLQRLLSPFDLPNRVPLAQTYLPPSELKALPSIPALDSEHLRLLRRLGLPYLPSPESLQAVTLTVQDGKALMDLVLWAWQQERECLEPLWNCLTQLRWMPNRAGALRSPKQLFIPGVEVEDLIGDDPSLYPSRSMPAALARRLGLKEADQVDASLVLDFFQGLVARGTRPPIKIYAFLEQSLGTGQVSNVYLRERLSGLDWVWGDDARFWPPEKVLALPAFRYFGSYRGSWEGAHQRFPNLARLFRIPESVTSASILDFLEEVDGWNYSPDLRRLLGACLAFLGLESEVPKPDWTVLPARALPQEEDVLVSARQPGVVRSNSPTLANLFARAGQLYVVDPGDRENSSALDLLYQKLEIPHLREAYTVRPGRAGSDVSEELGEAIAVFRQLLRALLEVLPRLRAARPELEEGQWLADTRLARLAGSGSIRVIQGLTLEYHFPQVARVEVEAAAAFDPEHRELLVSAEALTQPAQYAVALAEGLLDCLYQGPGSEGLVDLLNLLIPLGDRESMDHYLDLRHFPRPFAQESGRSALEERLGELLDYGFHRRLERLFPELEGAPFERWRDLELGNISGKEAASKMLRQLGLTDPPPDLSQTLEEMMTTGHLELVVSGEMPALPAPDPVSPQVQAQQPPSEEQVASSSAVAQPASGLQRLRDTVMGKLGRWMGSSKEGILAMGLNSEVQDVDVAQSYINPPARHLVVSTSALEGPDLYCLSSLGVDFDPSRQVYLPANLNWPQSFVPSGRTVDFTGQLTLPNHLMPKPLYSRLTRPPSVKGSKGTLRGPDRYGEYHLKTASEGARVSYTVELCAQPNYKVEARLHDIAPRLLQPTAQLTELPVSVREWIEWARHSGLRSWDLAERAREFVIDHYCYDLAYQNRPEVAACLRSPLEDRENRFLRLLHLGASEVYLGRGVCLELSALLLEILRRIGVPSVMAHVWMLDQGLIHAPDHVIVLALLQSARGPYWFPVDPSKNRVVQSAGDSDTAPPSRAELLRQAANIVLGSHRHLPTEPEALEKAILQVLCEPRLLEALLDRLAKSGAYLQTLSPETRWLVERGYLKVEEESLYRVWPNL